MPEIFSTHKGTDPLFADKTSEELDAMLATLTPEGDIPIPEEVVPEPEVVAAEPEPAATPEPEAPEETPVEDHPPTSDEMDLAASAIEGDRIAREKLEAALALQQAHSARLAGEIGYLKQKFASAPQSSEPYQPETQAEVDRLTALEERLAASEASSAQIAVSQAIESELASLDGTWVSELQAEVAAVAPKYADQILAARESGNPELARQISKAVGLLVKAEATQMRWDTQHKALVERKAASSAKNIVAKKATAPSGSGSVPAPVPKSKPVADMTAAEADAWLRENVL